MSRFCLLVCSLVLLLALSACGFPRRQPLEPHLHYTPHRNEIAALPSPFPALLPYERKAEWGREYLIGCSFARELDLYRAITAYKRALVLLPPEERSRELEIQYSIALCYYLGQKYADVLLTVEESGLCRTGREFLAYRELLLILHESYVELKQPAQAAIVLQQLESIDSQTAADITLSSAVRSADFPLLCRIERTRHPPDLNGLLKEYCQGRKSIGRAQTLNAILPGMGYLYVGQKQSAVTALLINGLFIWGAYEFFSRGYIAPAVLMTSFEVGWYFGGIYGAGEAAHLYNRRLYERLASPYLRRQRLYPVFMLRFSF